MSSSPEQQPHPDGSSGPGGPGDTGGDAVWAPLIFAVDHRWPLEEKWVAERGFRWLPDCNILLLVEDDVDQQMISDFRNQPADMVLLGHGPLVGFLARFGPLWGWMETFLWWRPGQEIPETLTYDPDLPNKVMFAYLVDAATKNIAAMRPFTLSGHFNKTLCKEVADRWVPGTDEAGGQAAFADFAAKYPTDRDTLKAGLVRCHAGD